MMQNRSALVSMPLEIFVPEHFGLGLEDLNGNWWEGGAVRTTIIGFEHPALFYYNIFGRSRTFI